MTQISGEGVDLSLPLPPSSSASLCHVILTHRVEWSMYYKKKQQCPSVLFFSRWKDPRCEVDPVIDGWLSVQVVMFSATMVKCFNLWCLSHTKLMISYYFFFFRRRRCHLCPQRQVSYWRDITPCKWTKSQRLCRWESQKIDAAEFPLTHTLSFPLTNTVEEIIM